MKSEFCGGDEELSYFWGEFSSFSHGVCNSGGFIPVGHCIPEKEIYNWATGRGYIIQKDLNDIQGD